MDSIDSFVTLPLLIAIIAGALLAVFLIISKIRNTQGASFIFFIIAGVYIVGLAYTCYDRHIIYLAVTILLTELLALPYVIVVAFENPKKKEAKKEKKEKELLAAETAELSAETKKEIADKYESIMKESESLIARTAGFFNSKDALSDFFGYFTKLLTDRTKADGCAVLLLDEFDNVLAVKSLTGAFPPPYKLPDDLPHKPLRVETNFRFAQFQLSGNIFGDIVTAGKAENVRHPEKDPRIFQNKPEDFLVCGPYAFLPLMHDGTATGVVCLSRKPGTDGFSDEEFEAASTLCSAASTALRMLNSFLAYAEHTELTKEGDIAVKFQKFMLPEKLPAINKLSIGKYSIPAANIVSDYYDVIASRKDRITFIVGDIAGKGMNSLVNMIMVRAMLRLIANTNQSAATLLEWVNRAICSDKGAVEHFASIALINYNSLDDTAQIATCGINPVLLYSAKTDSIRKISVESEPVGVEKTTQYQNIDVSLSAGDILATCTDGLLECLNEDGVQFSLDKFKNMIVANKKLSGRDIANKVRDSIKKFCGTAQQYDDQSLLIVKIQG